MSVQCGRNIAGRDGINVNLFLTQFCSECTRQVH